MSAKAFTNTGYREKKFPKLKKLHISSVYQTDQDLLDDNGTNQKLILIMYIIVLADMNHSSQSFRHAIN